MNHKPFSHSSKTVAGISFIYGENQTQRYYETIARGVRYIVLQPQGWHYWVIIADRQGALRPLNTAIVESGTYIPI